MQIIYGSKQFCFNPISQTCITSLLRNNDVHLKNLVLLNQLKDKHAYFIILRDTQHI